MTHPVRALEIHVSYSLSSDVGRPSDEFRLLDVVFFALAVKHRVRLDFVSLADDIDTVYLPLCSAFLEVAKVTE